MSGWDTFYRDAAEKTNKRSPTCKCCIILESDKLSELAKEQFSRALKDSRISAKAISDSLSELDYTVSSDSVLRHRSSHMERENVRV